MPNIFVASKKKPVHTRFRELFLTYRDYPQDIKFKGQHPSEKIILLLRRHWVTNTGWIIASIILFLTPFFVLFFDNVEQILTFAIPLNYQLAVFLFWYIGIFGYVLVNYLFWYYNVNIITNERIVDVDFIYLLYSKVSSTVISKIEDITFKRGGFFEMFFDYGSIYIQTAGTEPNFDFIGIPKPNHVESVITDLLEGKQL